MMKYRVIMSSKGLIAIPKKIREQLSSDILEMTFVDGEIKVRPIKSVLEIGGRLSGYTKKHVDKKNHVKAWEEHVKEKFANS